MSFSRTASGLSNLHLFYSVDLIIFTEGGERSFTIEDVEKGNYNHISADIKFWKYVLSANNFSKKVQFRAIGSKTICKLICHRIVSGEVKNVAVAMDRDLDEYFEEIFESPFILYTKGYSWENDVFTKDITYKQITSMLLMDDMPEKVKNTIDQAYQNFEKVGYKLIKLEIIFRTYGIKFISDVRGEKFFNGNKCIFIDKKQIKHLLDDKKKELPRPIYLERSFKISNFYLSIYGKLLKSFSLSVIHYICRKYTNIKSIPSDLIVSAMIERFGYKIKNKKDIYYFNLVERLKLALE